MTDQNQTAEPKPHFQDIVLEAIKRHGTLAVARQCRTSVGTVERWAAGGSMPWHGGCDPIITAIGAMDGN